MLLCHADCIEIINNHVRYCGYNMYGTDVWPSVIPLNKQKVTNTQTLKHNKYISYLLPI